jgi:hypothetical protein
MTDVPAPPPALPAQYRKPSRARRLIDSNLTPLAVAIVALMLGVYVLVGLNQNTARVAAQANDNSAITAALNAHLNDSFCDWIGTIADVPVIPTSSIGATWVLQSRTTSETLGCTPATYTVPDSALCPLVMVPNPRCPVGTTKPTP